MTVSAVRLAAAPRTASSEPPRVTDRADVEQTLNVLQIALRQGDERLQELARRLPEARQAVAQLVADLESVQVQSAGGSAPAPARPVPEIHYRPPFERLTEKKALTFICQDEKISFFDFAALNKEMNATAAHQRRPAGFDLPGTDFHIQANSDGTSWTATRRPGRWGETWEQAQLANSAFRQVLASASPAEFCVVFVVWHDSFATYRSARTVAWDGGFEVGWEPMDPGEKLILILRAGGINLREVQ
jgi:hypothetical protein